MENTPLGPGARFSKAPEISGPAKPFLDNLYLKTGVYA